MSLEEIKEARLKKFQKACGVFGNVFPAKVARDFSVSEAIADFTKLSRSKKELSLCGRIFSVREHGAIIFCGFKDGSFDEEKNETASFQAFLSSDILGGENFPLFMETVDIGDFVEFKGSFFLTKTKEKTIRVSGWRIISKSMNPLPEKWHGITDAEEKFRKRYLDLLMSDETKKPFYARTKIVNEIRNFLNKNGFLEVETPVLQPVASGALAEPFKTHHNTLDADLYLRIAPELYLKKLLIGGIEKVYELGKNFRNEGVDVTHNPEFTMLEFYQAYKDSSFMMKFVEDMLKTVVKKISGRLVVDYEGEKINFSKKFATISFFDAIKRHALFGDAETASLEDYRLKASQLGIEFSESDSREKIADYLFKKVCRPKIIQPTFVIGHPMGLSPLAKKKEDNPELADRFQVVAGKLELVNGFSELNDPLDQAERFKKQAELKKAGDKEALEFDQSFLEAMEYGMPPAVGVGVGIDRLVMLLTRTHNVRDIILFPLLREKK